MLETCSGRFTGRLALRVKAIPVKHAAFVARYELRLMESYPRPIKE